MGVVRLFAICLLAMDLLIHASAFSLGVKRSGVKMPWERDPVNPVFAKRPRLIQPPVFVGLVPKLDEEVSIPQGSAEGRIRWSRTTSLIPWPLAQNRELSKVLEAWRIILVQWWDDKLKMP